MRQLSGRMERTLRSGSALAHLSVGGVTAALALTVGACLVTGNTDLPRPSEVPVVRPLSPPGIAYVPFAGDPECSSLLTTAADPGMLFKANISYPDTETDSLYVQIWINGQALSSTQYKWALQVLKHNPDGTQLRTPDSPLCVPHSLLGNACNEVLILVSGELSKTLTLSSLTDADTASYRWYVIGNSLDHAEATTADCLPPLVLDGGV